ncbi:MAG TPA: hypothetical protein VHB98_19070 [Chloroflexota bacterium]|nr:hypothetical protein [Chloroflexota bacterium]
MGAVHASSKPADALAGDLTSVGNEARLPDSGRVRFVRASLDGSLIFVGLQDGALERSADAGHSWHAVPTGVPGGSGEQPLDLQISQSDPRVVWTAGLSGVYRSTDGGLTWVEADTRSDAPGRALGSVLALDPRHPLAAYLAGYRTGGFYLTADGGQSWQQTIPYPVSGIAVDPANGAVLYAISRTAGVQQSIDHGHTWARGTQLGRYAGIGQETANPGRLLMVDGPSGGLFAALDGGGLERSPDGHTWQDLSAGLPQSAPGAGLAVPFDLTVAGAHLYLVMPGSAPGGTLFSLPLATLAAPRAPTSTAINPATAASVPITATAPLTGTTASSAPAAVQWQTIASHVDAMATPPHAGTAPLVASEASLSAGVAAAVASLGGAPFYGVPYLLPPPSIRVAGDGFAYGATPIPYLYGINYEGPNDRPWQMWQDGKFDPALIALDLDTAASVGYRVLRVFVQDPLPQQVLQGEFGHLDTLVTLARQRGLRLLITFNDSKDADLARVAQVDHLIAAHLAGNPTIFGYDLQNEPRYPDIAGAIYPPGVAMPFQSAALVQRYGQQISLKAVRAGRRAGQWQYAPLDHMTDEQAYVYLNVDGILGDFLAANPDYPATPPSAHWAAFATAVNQTLASFIGVQLQAIRSADRAHLVTIGYNNLFWASLPANEALDFRTIHLYPNSQDWNSMHSVLREFESLRADAASPLVLGEYGLSTNSQSGAVAAVQESAMSLYLRVLGGEGDFKWVLNDDLVGYNPYENGLGLIARSGPKPGYYVDREIAAYFAQAHQPGGVSMGGNSTTGVGYLYAAPDALGVSGASYSDSRVRYVGRTQGDGAQLWLDWARPGLLRVVSSAEADLWLNMAALVNAQGGPIILSPAQAFDQNGLKLHIHLQPGEWYSVTYTPGATLPPLAPGLPRPVQAQGWYILSTGHNVSPPFLKTWLALGGVSVAGDPLDDAQTGAQGATQYFTALALRAHGSSVGLLPLGLEALGGHAAAAVPALPKKQQHLYFPATGHNLRGAFLTFWRSTGGLAVWGAPITEEYAKGSLTVQYTTNAELVWDGTGVSLGSLGARAWAQGTQ